MPLQILFHICSFDHPHVIEGQGTVGIEIIEQVPDVQAVLIPCGGGSLLAGVAVAIKHLKPDTEIYVSFKYPILFYITLADRCPLRWALTSMPTTTPAFSST